MNFKGREVIAAGMEHVVLKPNDVNSAILKVTRPFNRLSFWPQHPSDELRSESREAQELVDNTSVKIPRTVKYTKPEEKFRNL